MKRAIILFLLFCALPASAAHLHPEKYYQKQWCDKKGGIMEYKVTDGRVDCLTEKYAVEIDFAPKWAECIGQALYYGKQTKHIPACALIMENGEKDLKFFLLIFKLPLFYLKSL